MDVRFDIIYDVILQRLIVSQNGNPVSSYSQFARCSGQPFLNWYQKLPQYCFSEANNSYTVALESGLVFAEILRKTFLADSNCRKVQLTETIISASHRMRWADELLEASGFSMLPIRVPVAVQDRNVRLASSPVLAQMDASGTTWCVPSLKKLDITLRLENGTAPAAVILSDEKGLEALPAGNYPAVAAILPRGQEPAFMREVNGVFLFSCHPDHMAAFLLEWILSVFLPPALVQLQQRLSGFRNWNGMDAELADAKRKLLTAREPYLRLKVPSQIELHQTGTFSLVKLPEDMRCKARSDHPDIALLEQGNVIRPRREGTASFTVMVQGHPEFSVKQHTDVYRYTEVVRIQLTASRSVVREGERLMVNCAFHPPKAHNTGHARWDMSPGDLLKQEPNGVFLALRSGTCSIRVTVGAVTETLSVTILARPVGVDFDRRTLAVKLGDISQSLRVNLLPAGSQGGQVQYRISDPNILQIDTKNGQITPLAEGNAIITADLVDHGVLVDSATCCVTVLPPKDIVTPDSALLFLILSLLVTAMLYVTPYWGVPAIAAVFCAIWYAIRQKKTVITVLCVIFSLILCAVLFGNL